MGSEVQTMVFGGKEAATGSTPGSDYLPKLLLSARGKEWLREVPEITERQ